MHPAQHSTIHRKPPFPRAKDESTHNPTVQQQRITLLIKGAAERLCGLGTPQKRVRVLHMEHSTGEAA